VDYPYHPGIAIFKTSSTRGLVAIFNSGGYRVPSMNFKSPAYTELETIFYLWSNDINTEKMHCSASWIMHMHCFNNVTHNQ
jgi:hypothetical protein